jgi:hypothetical protein
MLLILKEQSYSTIVENQIEQFVLIKKNISSGSDM